MLKNYETVFILNPVLSDEQMKDAAAKFVKILTDNGSEIVNEELWGLRKLAYPIQHKTTGFYVLVEFKADPQLIAKLDVEFRRDERIMRYLTTVLDKYAVEYNERRKRGDFRKRKKEAKEEPAS